MAGCCDFIIIEYIFAKAAIATGDIVLCDETVNPLFHPGEKTYILNYSVVMRRKPINLRLLEPGIVLSWAETRLTLLFCINYW